MPIKRLAPAATTTHKGRKLTAADAEHIRWLHGEGVRNVEIAHAYGLSQSVVSYIVKGMLWKKDKQK